MRTVGRPVSCAPVLMMAAFLLVTSCRDVDGPRTVDVRPDTSAAGDEDILPDAVAPEDDLATPDLDDAASVDSSAENPDEAFPPDTNASETPDEPETQDKDDAVFDNAPPENAEDAPADGDVSSVDISETGDDLSVVVDAVTELPCDPSCNGRLCGSDGCGDLCGTCPGSEICDEQEGTCSIEGVACHEDLDCWGPSTSLCEWNHCRPLDEVCEVLPIDCDDGNPFTFDYCDPGSGMCSGGDPPPVCEVDLDCQTGDLCHDAFCQPSHEAADSYGCVRVNLNCSDGDPCTEDSCAPDIGCVFTDIPGCIPG